MTADTWVGMWPITDPDRTLADLVREVEAGPLQDLLVETSVVLDAAPAYRLGADERGRPLLLATAPGRPWVDPGAGRRHSARRKTPERSHSTTVTAP